MHKSSRLSLLTALGAVAAFSSPVAVLAGSPGLKNAFEPQRGVDLPGSPNRRPRGANMAFIRRARKLRSKARAKR